MSAWMTIPAWPSPRSTPTRRPPAPPRFSPPRSPTTSISASRVRRVLTDTGGCYRSRAFNARCFTAGLRHRYTRPFTPRTNGKAERFIQTALREWAYAHVYHTSAERAAPSAAPGYTRLQLAPATRQSQGQAAHQPNRADRGQPVEVPQLVAFLVPVHQSQRLLSRDASRFPMRGIEGACSHCQIESRKPAGSGCFRSNENVRVRSPPPSYASICSRWRSG